MPSDRDHYEIYYADKLWQLLPEVYRADDTERLDARGPLRELADRIGAQAAVLRRSIDRMWDDQSIETSDDWLIPYIAELLATNLVGGQDSRGQRLDVAKTIYYRRRKGTVAILEEIASDVTGWEAKVVEFFRRLGRSRHGYDPPLGSPEGDQHPDDALTLRVAEGLTGRLTGSSMGGTADLRKTYGATLAHTAFDEYFYTADFRRGRGQLGWYNIPHLGVFLWRLYSFEVPETTPVAVSGCPGHFCFDPTGREIPLFAANARKKAGFGGWVPAEEWQMPTPIRKLLLIKPTLPTQTLLFTDEGRQLYPASLAVQYQQALVDPPIALYPEIGRFQVNPTWGVGTLTGTYHYGFSSTIGAGPYDRRLLKQPPLATPGTNSVASGSTTGAALTAPAGAATLTIEDSLTYAPSNNAAEIQSVTLRAGEKQRPVVRMVPNPNPPTWEFKGAAGSELIIDGLLVSGGDVVLAGQFDRVVLNCCTLDPGNADQATGSFQKAVDGQDLVPTHLVVTGAVRELLIDRCITGPVQEHGSGRIEKLVVRDSIVQALWTDNAIEVASGDVELIRCSVLGRADVHRLEASECILNDIVNVDDTQHGCIRFSAWSTGSVIPRKYESVQIAPASPLFTARAFGQPGYGQLLDTVDRAIVAGKPGATISGGAEDGAEMGAFAREKYAIKRRSLAIKFEEFMPLGLVPVFIPVT